MGPSFPIARSAKEGALIRSVLRPDEFFDGNPRVVADFRPLLDVALDHFYAWDFDTGNDPCIDAAVVFLTRADGWVRDVLIAHIEAAANPSDVVDWWDRNETDAFRAIGICLVERYLNDGGWAGPLGA